MLEAEKCTKEGPGSEPALAPRRWTGGATAQGDHKLNGHQQKWPPQKMEPGWPPRRRYLEVPLRTPLNPGSNGLMDSTWGGHYMGAPEPVLPPINIGDNSSGLHDKQGSRRHVMG